MTLLFTQYHKKIFHLANAKGCTVAELVPNKYTKKGIREIIEAGYGDTTFDCKPTSEPGPITEEEAK